MKPSLAGALLLAAAAFVEYAEAIGSPFQLSERFCGEWDTRANDKLILYNNHWGAWDDKNGSQCTTVKAMDAVSGAISYETVPHWAGSAGQVKSFTNVETVVQPTRAYDIAAIPAKWKMQVTDDLSFDNRPVYNAAFDLFFGPTTNTSALPEYEVMVWVLARNGAWPLEQFGRFDVTIDGRVWTLHSGTNGPQRVLSFTTSQESQDVSLNLKGFVDAAVNYMLPKDYFLTKLQGGFEYFHGASRLVVSDYQVNVQKVATTVVPKLGQCNVPGALCADQSFCMSWNPGYSQCIETPARCPVQLLDTDIVGTDIKNIRDLLPGQCCDACASTPGCTAYTFVNYNSDGHAVCYLKSATTSTPRKAAKGIVSAMVDGGTQVTTPPTPAPASTPDPAPAPTPAPAQAPLVSKNGQCNIAGAKCVDGTFCMPWNPGYSQCIETPTQCPVQLLDTDIVGTDIKNIRDILPAQCCAACASTAGCTSYTFVNDNPDGHAVCYLKSATSSTERKASKGLVSAFLAAKVVPKMGQCNLPNVQCEDKTFCMSWDPNYSQCIETPAKCPFQLLDTDIVGTDIKNIRDILPGQCCDACASTAGCTSYTFVNYNPDGHAVCYLKSATASTERKTSKGLISAFVQT